VAAFFIVGDEQELTARCQREYFGFAIVEAGCAQQPYGELLFSGSGTHDLQPRFLKCLLDLLNPAERLSQNPAFRLIASEKTWDRGAKLALGVGKRRLPEKKLSKAAIRRSEIGGL
jgi:hypothetical protein